MEREILEKYNRFRDLCLANAEDALNTAEELQNKSVNHIAFYLTVYGLEEIGKIFIGWYQLTTKEKWDRENVNIPLDDHIKKIFWAIWWFTFAKEKITKKQISELTNLAKNLHNKRLDVMYTTLSDKVPSRQKISDTELGNFIILGKARLEIAKQEGSVGIELTQDARDDIDWFEKATSDSESRKYIFGNTSQEKLIELGDVKNWISWLKKEFQKEDTEAKEILKKELKKAQTEIAKTFEPKWRIKIKIKSKSHSIRGSVLNKVSANNPVFKFFKGEDNHTLVIDIYLDKGVNIKGLWNRGWQTSQLLVAALNVTTNGLFYWDIPRHADKFYEQMWDLESNKQLDAKLQTSLELDWSPLQMYLTEKELGFSFMVFHYFASLLPKKNFEAVNHFMIALGMFAKNDMHLRLEDQCFLNFYLAFKKTIIFNEQPDENTSIKDLGFSLIGYMLDGDRSGYDKVMDIGDEMEKQLDNMKTNITLTEVFEMKQYAGLYFFDLAAKKELGEKAKVKTEKIKNRKRNQNKK
jgi:AbiV family abortive infection protein